MDQELVKHTEHLPDTVEDLRRFLLINREMLQAHMAKLRAIDKVGLARDAHNAALTDAQNLGEVVLRAEAKLGELLKAIPKEPGKRTDKKEEPLFTKAQRLKELGMNQTQRHHAETLASHPKAIDQVIEQAKKKEEVPTRAAVLRVIHRETHSPKPREPKPKPKPEPESQEALQEARSKELKGGRPLMSQSFRNAVDELKREIIRAKQSGWKETGKQTALDYITGLINAIKY